MGNHTQNRNIKINICLTKRIQKRQLTIPDANKIKSWQKRKNVGSSIFSDLWMLATE